MHNIKFIGDVPSVVINSAAYLEVGDNVIMKKSVDLEVDRHAHLRLGNNVYVNGHSTIRCFHSISIGDNTLIGDGVRIYDFDHTFSDYHIGIRSFTAGAVSIGKNCWIGANCIITKGVTIGDNVIVGAGTLVRKDIPANTVAYSSPGGGVSFRPRHSSTNHAFILTASDQIEKIIYLLETLPQVDFHIAAPTEVSFILHDLGRRYANCQIYPMVHLDYSVEKLIDQADVYLDINHGELVDNIVERFLETGKPILSFTNASHTERQEVQYFSPTLPEEMAATIARIVEEKGEK